MEKKIKNKNHKKKPKENSTKIIVDHREKNSLVPSFLLKKSANLEFKQLKVADYIINNIAIERKTFSDLISSMINKRIFSQIQEIKQYPKPLIILEGYDPQINKGIKINAIRSFILSIATRYQIPLIFTEDPQETAEYLYLLSRKKSKEVSLNISKRPLTKNQELQFILESFKGIGPKTARKLLQKFKNLKNILNASEKELKNVLGKKSEEIFKVINRNYKK